ncbi:dihydropteroate synthase [Micromonospora auratinigra]|uniref:Dihydropteroate synthase n=1 Tax=Micromonospora auratinigra TaxID=261654 RepID=A0A1A8ZXS5_9ACTN|nr:dihydropteroate synthase [Micromonospora auratinigra]
MSGRPPEALLANGTVGSVTDLVRAQAPVVMGVLNVTPDSFSDGGRYADLDAAVGHGVRLRAAGADLVDVGGESTRPGADRVDAATETARVLPVVRELSAAGIAVSIDTSRARVAEAALAAGAAVVNDVSGGLADPDMARVVRDAGCPWVLMHWRGHSRRMTDLAHYTDVVADVRAELGERVDEALAAGVAADRIIVDPGLGFAKTAAHNWELSARLPELLDLGFPLLFGASRKSYLGRLLADAEGEPRPTPGREAATIATSLLAVAAGAWGVRVHDVRGTADALAVWRATGRPRLAAATPERAGSTDHVASTDRAAGADRAAAAARTATATEGDR